MVAADAAYPPVLVEGLLDSRRNRIGGHFVVDVPMDEGRIPAEPCRASIEGIYAWETGGTGDES